MLYGRTTPSILMSVFYTFDLESARRVIFLGPLFFFTESLGLSVVNAQHTLFLVTRFLAGFLTYVAAYNFLVCRTTNSPNRNAIFFASLFAGFFYAYNPISTTMISTTIFFAFSYSFIPLIFYFFDKSLNENGFRNMLVTSLLITLALAGTTQFLVLLPLTILFPWFVITLLKQWYNKKSIILPIKNFFLVCIFTLAMSFYWIIVSIFQYLQGRELHPGYVLTYEQLQVFSNNLTLDNIFRLLGDWWPRVTITPPSIIIDQTSWTVMSFIIPITIILFILFSSQSKLRFYIIALSLLSLIVIFFDKGVQAPFAQFYPVLYEIPVVGWMFRVPSKFGFFLSFYFTMILTLGFYGLFSMPLKARLSPLIRFAPSLAFVVCISIICWPMFTGDFGALSQNNFEQSTNMVTPASSPSISDQLKISSDNVLVFGGRDKFFTLSNSSLVNMNDTGFIFADESMSTMKQNVFPAVKNVILNNQEDLMMQLLSNRSVIISPYDATIHHKPSDVWSKAATHDPLHAPFHTYLERFSINNSEGDLGKGLVITWDEDVLEIPLQIPDFNDSLPNEQYDLYIRYMQNKAGGLFRVTLDGERLAPIESTNQTNRFVWKKITTLPLTAGQHNIAIENIRGFNTVNVMTLIPSKDVPYLERQVDEVLDGVSNIYLLNPSDFQSVESSGNGANSDGTQYIRSGAVNILKSSQYTVAIKVYTCPDCPTISVKVGNGDYKSLQTINAKNEYKWIGFKANLTNGNNLISVISNESNSSFDSMILFDGYNFSSNNIAKSFGSLFNAQRNPNFGTPAEITRIDEIDPTKVNLEINATKPFMLKFFTPYDSLWTLRVGELEYEPIPVFPSENGFVIDKVGYLKASLEYEPQIWLKLGMAITIIISSVIIAYSVVKWRRDSRRRVLYAESNNRSKTAIVTGTDQKALDDNTKPAKSREQQIPKSWEYDLNYDEISGHHFKYNGKTKEILIYLKSNIFGKGGSEGTYIHVINNTPNSTIYDPYR